MRTTLIQLRQCHLLQVLHGERKYVRILTELYFVCFLSKGLDFLNTKI